MAQRTALSGVVRSAADSSPIERALIEIVDGPKTSTQENGSFWISHPGSGKVELRVRRLGFYPYVRVVNLRTDSASVITVAMEPLPQELKEVRISGKRVVVPYRFEDVYRRAASGFGHLITLEDIERRRPFYVRELLNDIPGITVDNYKVRFRRCGDGVTNGPAVDLDAHVQVYIDGVRVGEDVDYALSLVNVTNVQAIEVYVGIAQLPGEFATNACAAIAVWTKRY
ncbi:MAG TPA: carboxypeptidase regulatory-like domain-containing protein [Gemmatimonadaceae bacterium]